MKSYLKPPVLFRYLVVIGIVMAFATQILPIIGLATILLWAIALQYSRKIPLRKDYVLFSIFLLMIILPASFKPYFGISPLFYVVSLFGTVLIAHLLSDDLPALFRAYRLLYFTMALAIAAILAAYGGSDEPFGQVIPGASQNGIPAYLIVVQTTYSSLSYIVNRKLPLVSPFFTLIVSFYGEGRGSIVIAFAILIATMGFLTVIRSRGWFGALVKHSILLGFVGVVVHYGGEILLYATIHTKLSVGLFDVNRYEIILAYLDKLNGYSLLFGADYAGTIIGAQYEDNPHLSLIRSHAFFGLVPTLILFLSPFLIWTRGGEFLPRLIAFSFLYLAVVRALSEPLLFPTLLDGLFFSVIFSIHKMSPNTKRQPRFAFGTPSLHRAVAGE